MKFVENIISAYLIYDELKNIQIGVTLERLKIVLNELKDFENKAVEPEKFEYLFKDLKNPYNITYGNLEMLRAMKILKEINEKKAIYKLTSLGRYIIKQKSESIGLDLVNILLKLNSIKILVNYVKVNVETNAVQISSSLGEEMSYYNKILLGKSIKKPFNEPISQILLDLLVESRILQRNENTKMYFY